MITLGSLTVRCSVTGLLVSLLCACQPRDAEEPSAGAAAPSPGFLVGNVIIIDGTGAPGFAGSVRVNGALIEAVGELSALPGESVIDGGGQVLAPGFIDTHSHADRHIFEQPQALAAVSQGITTAVVGQDGGVDNWLLPLSAFFERLERQPAAINIAAYAAHNNIRQEVMGGDFRRPASAAEIERMETLLEDELNAGALGLSTGLEYDPGIYSDPDEIIRLARLTAQHGGRYISHIRSEDRWFDKAVDEAIAVGRDAGIPVQISHMKLAMKSLWGTAPALLAKLDSAREQGIDVTADIYPYEYWQSFMYVLLPDRDISNRSEVEFALNELAPPEGMWLSRFDPQPEYVGKSLAEIARLRGIDPATAFQQLFAESAAWAGDSDEPADKIIATSMSEADIAALLSWPHSNVCTDGSLNDLHPRGAGSFTRVLGHYVRELGALPLEQAIRKMTSLSATHMGITDRGLIRPGLAADLVLFDPATVIDNATPQEPSALSSGISRVWVNGETVYTNGKAGENRPGVVIRRRLP